MLVDIHTNLGWYPDHYSDEFVEFALAAKKAKMRITPDVYFAGEEEGGKRMPSILRPKPYLKQPRTAIRLLCSG